jgi:hypothetical protein
MSKPLAIDLYSGLGGWTEGLLAEGFRVVGFDNERHVYGEHRYPGQLVIQNVLTLHGRQFKDASLIVASPPCIEYSYMAMPWKRGKRIAQALRGCGDSSPLIMDDGQVIEFDSDGFPLGYTGSRTVAELNALFDACFRIQREAIEAAGHRIPLVVENVCGAQPLVGQARWHYGSYYLFGDVPALMPMVRKAQKVPGFRFDGSGKSFQTASVNGVNDPQDNPPHTPHMTNPNEHGIKNGGDWFSDPASPSRTSGSKSSKRKAASAMIAKIPLPLSRHIAATWRPA